MKITLGVFGMFFAAAMLNSSVLPAAAKPAPEPEYRQAPARLWAPRDGLGNVFEKLKAGKDVSIAYFGGSITAQEGWRPKTLQWFRTTYPHSKITEINAAIGGTGSDLGVFRFRQDVLSRKPDLVFVEFAVNDSGQAPEAIWRSMEGIVRQAWKSDPHLDLCYVYTYVNGFSNDLDRGLCPRSASADEMLAEHYGIPSINVALRTAELIHQGKMIVTPEKDAEGHVRPTPPGVILFSTDGVHPLDAGHVIYTEVITSALRQAADASRPVRHSLRRPFVRDNWQDARLAPLDPSMLSPGWRLLDPNVGLAAGFHDRMPEIWEAARPGAAIHLRFRGTAVGVYDIMGPDAGQALCSVDGQAPALHSRFDVFSAYHRLSSFMIAQDLRGKVHSVTIEVSPVQPDRSAVVNEQKAAPGFDPCRFHGTVLRVGSLMIVGSVERGRR
ncbi:MAG: SGNH/GDSL hydrolase family protein [Chloroflexi bacterium]|nr:SGNH/GDSL hydrolase family protein [Chloroflexota bacterium]